MKKTATKPKGVKKSQGSIRNDDRPMFDYTKYIKKQEKKSEKK